MPGTARKTLEQGRAEFAYRCVEQVLSLEAFKFGHKTIDTHRLILNWLNKKLNNKYKECPNYKDSPIYKEFIENPKGKLEEYTKLLEGLNNEEKNNLDNDNKLKNNIVEYYKKYGKEYKSYAKKIPMLIKNNGLGSTFAFVKSKAKDSNAYQLLYCQTGEWLRSCQQTFIDLPEGSDLVAQIISLDSPNYRAVTVEVLALFNWLKRFADGLIEGEIEGDGDDE